MNKQEMPAQIWAYPQDGQSTRGRWHNVPVQHANTAEYLRADLPPTPAEAMRCPEVAALVDELHYTVLCLKTIALHNQDDRFTDMSRIAWLRLQDILDALKTQDQNEAV